MPALPYIGAAIGAAGAINQNDANTANKKSLQSQIALEAEKFGWTKEQAQNELIRRTEASNRYWEDYNKIPELSMEDATSQASNQLSPEYDQTMKTTLDNLDTNLISRGFFGQAPGAQLTQNTASKVAESKANATSDLAQQLFQISQANKLANKQIGMNTFGSYGVQTVPEPYADKVINAIKKKKPKWSTGNTDNMYSGGDSGGSDTSLNDLSDYTDTYSGYDGGTFLA